MGHTGTTYSTPVLLRNPRIRWFRDDDENVWGAIILPKALGRWYTVTAEGKGGGWGVGKIEGMGMWMHMLVRRREAVGFFGFVKSSDP